MKTWSGPQCDGCPLPELPARPKSPYLRSKRGTTVEMRVDLSVATGLAVAGLAGLAVGIEREWSGHATGPAARFAGVRTFLLLGLLGGLAGWLIDGGLLMPGALSSRAGRS